MYQIWIENSSKSKLLKDGWLQVDCPHSSSPVRFSTKEEAGAYLDLCDSEDGEVYYLRFGPGAPRFVIKEV